MLGLYLSPLYIAANVYAIWRILRWMSAVKPSAKWLRVLIVIVYAFLAVSPVTAFLLPPGSMQRAVKLVANYWLGIDLYTLMAVILFHITGAIVRAVRKNSDNSRAYIVSGFICLLLVAGTCIYGAVNARIIRTTKYDITIKKHVEKFSDMKAVLVADLHMGYNIGCGHISQMVDKINALDADVVFIAGDIFDNQYEALDDPDRLAQILKGIKSKYGVYACYGNHDIQEKILAGFTFSSKGEKKESHPKMDELLKNSNIELFSDKGILLDDSVYIYCRPDAALPGRGIDKRKTPSEITASMDREKPIIIIEHEPRGLGELSEAGVDADLCGHTHDGQLFPANITCSLMWENSYGYMKKGDMHSIVTSGVGLFGPFMRVATIPEICEINMHFE